MAMVVVDASVVIGVLDMSDAQHTRCARAVLDRSDANWILPVSVLSESLVAASRRGDDAIESTRRLLVDGYGPPRSIDEPVVVAAARLRAVHRSLRLPDALVLAIAQVDGADEVLTCDQRWAKVSERVTVVG